MGNTIIAPNIKKITERIDTFGNVIDPRTKQVIIPVEKSYVPTPEELSHTPTPQITDPVETPKTSKIDDMISKKIEEIINRKIEEALSKI